MAESEAVLLKRFTRSGDAEAFAEIIRRHAGLVYGAAWRILADVDRAADVAQETFLQLTRDAGTVTGSLPGWLHRVATHKAIDQRRRDASRRQRERAYVANEDRPRDLSEWKDLSPHVDVSLRELEPELREILILHFLEGRSTREIAARRGTSQATISRRIGAGVEQLRVRLRRRGLLVAVGTLSVLLGDHAVQAAPLPLLMELGKMAMVGGTAAGAAGAGSGLHTIATGVLTAVKTRAVTVAAVAVLGAGSLVTYHELTRSDSGPAISATRSQHGTDGSGPEAETQWDLPAVADWNAAGVPAGEIWHRESAASGEDPEATVAAKYGGMMGPVMGVFAEPRNDRREPDAGLPGGIHAPPVGSWADANEPATLTAAQLVDEYTKALDSLRSLALTVEIREDYEGAFDKNWADPLLRGASARGTIFARARYRTDGERFHSQVYLWGDLDARRPPQAEAQAHYQCRNWDGTQFYQHTRQIDTPMLTGSVSLQPPAPQFQLWSRNPPVAYALGYNLASDDRMDAILRQAEDISVRPALEVVAGAVCHVVDAVTPQGRLSLWIDPSHGYHPARVECTLAEGDRDYGWPLTAGGRRTTCLEQVRFQFFPPIWVPVEADVVLRKTFPGGDNHAGSRYHYRLTEVRVNPDHAALGSFDQPLERPENDPELQNGTHVRKPGDPVLYLWQDGVLIPKERPPGFLPVRPIPQYRGEGP